VIAALARCHPTTSTVPPTRSRARRSRIHVFLSTSEIHRTSMLTARARTRSSPRPSTACAGARVHRRRRVQPAGRHPHRRRLPAAHRRGRGRGRRDDGQHPRHGRLRDAARLRRADRRIVRRVGPDVAVSVHCHNDLGLAVANSIEAVRNGARQVEVAVNGIGERAGNCSMEEVVMALRHALRPPRRPTGRQHPRDRRTSRLVSALTGYPVQFNKAVVGKNAFAHESGIHQHGVLQDRLTYEIMDAEDVGMGAVPDRARQALGRHAFSSSSTTWATSSPTTRCKRAVHPLQGARRPQGRADRQGPRGDRRRRGLRGEEEAFELESLEVSGGTASATHGDGARTSQVDDGRRDRESAMGDGMVDAACGAIRRARAVDGAIDAHAGRTSTSRRHQGHRRARRRHRPGRGGRASATPGAGCPPTSSRPVRGPSSTRSTSPCACAGSRRRDARTP
jgi:2-isopropylmalate synthase